MNTKSTKEQQSELGDIVDMPLGNFIDKVKTENLGYILSLTNFFERLYFNLKKRADEAVSKAKDLPESKERNDLTLLIKDIYAKMQLIEDKVTYLKKEAKRREVDLTN